MGKGTNAGKGRQVEGAGRDEGGGDGRGIGARERGTGRVSKHTAEDRIEREVRRRVAETMSAAGVDSGRIATEVLYWLPEDFCRLYMQMTSRALAIDGGVSSTLGGSGDEGQVKAKVGTGPVGSAKKGGGGLWTRDSGAHARGTGKRYRNISIVRDEQAFKLKGTVDRKLREIATLMELGGRAREEWEGDGSTLGVAREQRLEGRGGAHGTNLGKRGLIPHGEKGQKRCEGCGKVSMTDWVICPRPHD